MATPIKTILEEVRRKIRCFLGGDFGGNYPFNNVSFLYHPSLICENHVMAVFN